MKEMWDSRYSAEDYAYGVSPNAFFKAAIDKYKLTGKILMPAEGEGRNAVYAAKSGLEVTAFDISQEGKNKALKLAASENVEITYEVGEFFDLDIIDQQYESAALIFAHFPTPLLSKYHKILSKSHFGKIFFNIMSFLKRVTRRRQVPHTKGGRTGGKVS